MRVAIDFAGLQLKTPIVLLSGCVGFGEEYTRVDGFSNNDIGAVILKGATLEARLGNPPTRVYETPAGMLNAIGLQNPGARYIVDNILPRLPFDQTHYWANINGASIAEYAEVARIFDNSAITALEINISCPNVKAGGVHFGNNAAMSARVVAAVRQVTNKVIITKLSPNNADIQNIATACIEAGSDALAVSNTLVGMAIDIDKRKPVLANVSGGLSGAAIKPVALWKVWQTYQIARKHNIPILGQGGIGNANDAVEFALAGSTAIGMGTSLFYDPLSPAKLLLDLNKMAAKKEWESFAQLTGGLQI
ncbi:MAG: dihydroorotate dehydrogenase [Mariprofundales bacterium]